MDISPHKRQQYRQGWLIVFCSAIFYMYQFIIRVSPNIMNDELLTHVALDAAGLDTLLGAYNWAYAAMQIPLGISMDRIGPRFFLCLATLICTLSCFIFGHTNNPMMGGLARFLMGMGSAGGFIGTVKLGILWFNRRQVAKVTSITILMGTVGASLGGAPLEMLLNSVGFEKTMEILGVIGLLISVLIYYFVQNKPNTKHLAKKAVVTIHNHPLTDLKILVKTPQAWMLAIYGMFMYLPITAIGVVWGVSFIESRNNISEILAASVVSTMFLGAALGSPVFSYFSDSIRSRRIPMALGAFLTSIIWLIIFTVDLPIFMLYVLFFMAGFLFSSKTLCFASICEMMPLNISGVSLAFVNMVIMSTGIFFLPIIGALIDFHWRGDLIGAMPNYVLEDYRFALLTIPICLLISLLMTLFLKETHPEHNILKKNKALIPDYAL